MVAAGGTSSGTAVQPEGCNFILKGKVFSMHVETAAFPIQSRAA